MVVRLLIDHAADGAWNMAVDEALLASAAQGITTLRFYSWLPATLSLGYFQSLLERESHSASSSCPVVRRASGGGAILHDHELTYSFAMPAGDRFDHAAEKIYDLFHQALIATLQDWQITAQFFRDTQQPAPTEDRFLCFERRSPNDLVIAGMKVVGSAQRRHQGALVQHGSVLLQQSRFAPELPGIAELTDHAITPHELSQRWLPSLASALGCTFAPGELTEQERSAAEAWKQERFSTMAWTGRRP